MRNAEIFNMLGEIKTSEIKKTSGVEIDFKHLILDFSPHPHIIFEQVVLSVPPAVKGKAVSLRVQPNILPLFVGEVQIAAIRLESAELDYILPKKTATGRTAPQPFSY